MRYSKRSVPLEGPEFKDTSQKKKPPPLEPDTDGGRNAEITKATVEPDNEGGRDAEINIYLQIMESKRSVGISMI